MIRPGLLLCALAGCSEPAPCPSRVVLDVEGSDLAMVGPQRVSVTWSAEGPLGATELDVSLVNLDGGVFRAASPRPLTRPLSTDVWVFEVPEPALLRATATARCGGKEVGATLAEWFVFDALSLEKRLPRKCGLLQPMGSELFDCDGQVVDLDGGIVPGWLPAARSWAVAPARWSYFPQVGELDWEPGDGGRFSLNVGPIQGWTAAESFAVLDNSLLVAFADGGLVASRFDAGIEADRTTIACAATVRDGRRYVGMCEEPFLTNWQVPTRAGFWRCEVVGEALSGCAEHTGYRVRHDPRTGRVLLLEQYELRWMDFVTGEVSQRYELPWWMRFEEGPPLLGFAGYRSAFVSTRWRSEAAGGQVVGEQNPHVLVYRDGAGIASSWELAWAPDDGGTRWTRPSTR